MYLSLMWPIFQLRCEQEVRQESGVGSKSWALEGLVR